MAPAATARRCTAIGSSTNSSIRTVVQRAEVGPRVPYLGRLRRQEERRAVNLEAGDDVALAEPPRDRRPERGLVERDRRLGVADREHRSDAGGHPAILCEGSSRPGGRRR